MKRIVYLLPLIIFANYSVAGEGLEGFFNSRNRTGAEILAQLNQAALLISINNAVARIDISQDDAAFNATVLALHIENIITNYVDNSGINRRHRSLIAAALTQQVINSASVDKQYIVSQVMHALEYTD